MWLVALLLLIVWVLISSKISRFDGVLVEPVHPYRRLMSHIMDKKSESTVYFDAAIDAEPLLNYVEEASQQFHVDFTHCFVAAGCIAMARVPSMNRFVSGRRLYQRKHIEVSFSMKRKRKDRAAKLGNVKLRLKPGETFRSLCERMQSEILIERSEVTTHEDREYGLMVRLPRAVISAAISTVRGLDYYNIAPRALLEPDPLFSSLFIANLGSIEMAAGFHHLFEWGNCSIFVMVGAIEWRPVVSEDGQVRARRMLPVRFTYDERIDDGINAGVGIAAALRAVERPYEYLGCIRTDGSDARPLDTPDPA